MGNYRNKYHNRRVCGYDSAKEARRAEELRLLQLAGEISDLQEQVSFELIPTIYAAPDGTFVQADKQHKLTQWHIKKHGLWCAERCCVYIADFVYKDKSGKLVVEDSKGLRTPEYIIKRKLMLWLMGIKITET